MSGSLAVCNQDGRLIKTKSTMNYFIESHYYPKLLENLKDGLELFLKTGETWNYACDVYWNQLIKDNTWYILNPIVCRQRNDYSDIEKKTVDYDEFYKLTVRY
jgi:hypothetical protein